MSFTDSLLVALAVVACLLFVSAVVVLVIEIIRLIPTTV